MSISAVEKFVNFMVQVPELRLKVGFEAAVGTPSYDNVSAFAAASVKAADQLGLQFTEEECRAWLEEHAADFSDGSLSEAELDLVAGGGTPKPSGPTSKPATSRR